MKIIKKTIIKNIKKSSENRYCDLFYYFNNKIIIINGKDHHGDILNYSFVINSTYRNFTINLNNEEDNNQ